MKKPKLKKMTINYDYFDAGNHWCKSCNSLSSNIHDFLFHLGSKKHQQVSSANCSYRFHSLWFGLHQYLSDMLLSVLTSCEFCVLVCVKLCCIFRPLDDPTGPLVAYSSQSEYATFSNATDDKRKIPGTFRAAKLHVVALQCNQFTKSADRTVIVISEINCNGIFLCCIVHVCFCFVCILLSMLDTVKF